MAANVPAAARARAVCIRAFYPTAGADASKINAEVDEKQIAVGAGKLLPNALRGNARERVIDEPGALAASEQSSKAARPRASATLRIGFICIADCVPERLVALYSVNPTRHDKRA